MRSTGFIGPADEIMQHWLARTKNRAESLASRPDIITDSFYKKSLSMSKKMNPSFKYSLVEKHINSDSFYRRNKRFSIVAFPDGESLVRSGLPLDKMFISAADVNGNLKKSVVVNIAMEEYDDYLEFVPHATDIDFLAEALFIPSITTLEDFKKYTAEMMLLSIKKSSEISQWLWETALSSVMKAMAGCAFRLWALEIKAPGKDMELPKLTQIFAALTRDLGRVLAGDSNTLFFSKVRSSCMTAEEIDTLKFFIEVFPAGPRKILSVFVKESARDINVSICRNGGPNISLYMAGAADIIMLRTGETGNMDCFIPWITRTASSFPDTIFYALSLERWTKYQLETFENAITKSGSGSLIIWTSAQRSAVPAFLLKNDSITREAYEDGGFCFKAVSPEPPYTYFRSIGVEIPEAERLEDFETRDGKNLLYEIGFVSKELDESIVKHKKDPFAGTEVNAPKESLLVLSPYMILPDDTIEKVRYKALKALQYNPGDISKAVLISNAVPEFYNWIAEAMENRAKIPKLNSEEVKKKEEGIDL